MPCCRSSASREKMSWTQHREALRVRRGGPGLLEEPAQRLSAQGDSTWSRWRPRTTVSRPVDLSLELDAGVLQLLDRSLGRSFGDPGGQVQQHPGPEPVPDRV